MADVSVTDILTLASNKNNFSLAQLTFCSNIYSKKHILDLPIRFEMFLRFIKKQTCSILKKV